MLAKMRRYGIMTAAYVVPFGGATWAFGHIDNPSVYRMTITVAVVAPLIAVALNIKHHARSKALRSRSMTLLNGLQVHQLCVETLTHHNITSVEAYAQLPSAGSYGVMTLAAAKALADAQAGRIYLLVGS